MAHSAALASTIEQLAGAGVDPRDSAPLESYRRSRRRDDNAAVVLGVSQRTFDVAGFQKKDGKLLRSPFSAWIEPVNVR
jgi:2-polyprenyl-6-methoxyphenol hydroxylase-like FAD-dependent oxidoreductase